MQLMQLMKPAAMAIGVGATVLFGAGPVAFAQQAAVTAESATHTATLTGAEAVPPIEGAGSGTAWFVFDEQTLTLTWTVEYDGLTGPATGAHLHGPAEVGAIATSVFAIAIGSNLASPLSGSRILTAAQADQLTDGLWYVDIHTRANPNGEIRGQVVAVNGG